MSGLMRHVLVFVAVVFSVVPAMAVTEVCILVGAAGDPELGARFHGWAARVADALEEKHGLDPERISSYPANAKADGLTREKLAEGFEELAARLGADDRLVVILVGHGSDQGMPKFMLDGPDATASDFRTWLDAIDTEAQLVINTASASGGFVGYLSAPNRAVCTSTQSGTERNAPEFMEHLTLALEEGRGDEDRNGRLSWREWLNAAASRTAAWYEKEGLIATEHALLDDDGDGQGSRLPLALADSGDGAFSYNSYLSPTSIRRDGDNGYAEAIAAVEAWKTQRDSVEASAYWTRLEELLLEAARRYPGGP